MKERRGVPDRMHWLAIVLLTAGAATPLAGQAQGTPLTLDMAARSALARSPVLEAADATSDATAAALTEARSSYFPTLSLDGAATRFQEPMVVAPLHGFDPTMPPRFDRTLVQGGLSLTWTLFDGGARGSRVARAVALSTSASLGADAARGRLLAGVARAYLRARSAREVLDAASRRVTALAAEGERSERMRREGRAADVDVLRATAALSRARADSASASAQADAALRELARLMGVSLDSLADRQLAAPTSPALTLPPREELLRRALTANPELAQARARAVAAAAARGEARSAWLPRFQALGRYQEFGSGAGHYTGEWQGGVQLSYPLFTGGRRLGAADRAAAEARAAAAQAAAAEQDVERDLDGALTALESASARVSALTAAVRQSEEVVRIERLALSTGAGTQSDYLSAEAALYEARAALTEAAASQLSARVELARVTGELSLEWVEEL